jgi:hypothetical protein
MDSSFSTSFGATPNLSQIGTRSLSVKPSASAVTNSSLSSFLGKTLIMNFFRLDAKVTAASFIKLLTIKLAAQRCHQSTPSSINASWSINIF